MDREQQPRTLLVLRLDIKKNVQKVKGGVAGVFRGFCDLAPGVSEI